MRLGLALLVSLLTACPALAQNWATREVCTVDTPAIHAEVFPEPGLEALTAEATTIPNPRGRFWQITAPNGAVSHLWGTFHSTDKNILRLPPKVKATLEGARVVAPEFDFVAPSRAAYRRIRLAEDYFKEAGDPFDPLLPDTDRIAGLSPEVSDWIRERLFDLGWGEEGHLVLAPGGLAALLLAAPCDDFASGVFPIQDQYIQMLGVLAGARVQGLEHPLALFDDLKGQDDIANAMVAVYASYLQPQTDNRARSTGIRLYQEGRIGLMMTWDKAHVTSVLGPRGRIALKMTDDYLLGFRNQRFLDNAETSLMEGGMFLAVGAFHLPGDDGLIELLRARGHTVRRIPLPGEAP